MLSISSKNISSSSDTCVVGTGVVITASSVVVSGAFVISGEVVVSETGSSLTSVKYLPFKSTLRP